MSKFIQQLASRLKEVQNLPMAIQHNDTQILVTLPVASDRKQTVKIELCESPAKTCHLVRLQSRASVAHNPATVRSALRLNNGISLGGLALDTSTSPPSLDVVYSLVANHFDFEELFLALQLVASSADAIERRSIGGDQF